MVPGRGLVNRAGSYKPVNWVWGKLASLSPQSAAQPQSEFTSHRSFDYMSWPQNFPPQLDESSTERTASRRVKMNDDVAKFMSSKCYRGHLRNRSRWQRRRRRPRSRFESIHISLLTLSEGWRVMQVAPVDHIWPILTKSAPFTGSSGRDSGECRWIWERWKFSGADDKVTQF